MHLDQAAEVKDLNYYEVNGKKYYVDKKYVVLKYTKKEREIALFLVNNIGGKIYMVPKVNYPKGIKTPDYLWNNEKWDLKEIKGSGKNILDDSVKRKKHQANSFIIEITKSKMSTVEIERQIKKLFDNNKRRWIKKIIVIKNGHYKVLENKKRS